MSQIVDEPHRGLQRPASPRVAAPMRDALRSPCLSDEALRGLGTLHEGFARGLSASLSGDLRTGLSVGVGRVEQPTFGEFTASLPSPACVAVLASDGADAGACLEISPLIGYPMIDRLLGGSAADVFVPQRPLTQIEQRLMQRVIDRCAHHLSEAWSGRMPAMSPTGAFQCNARQVELVSAGERVVVVRFEVRMGSRAGGMALCLPTALAMALTGASNAEHSPLDEPPCPEAVELRAVLARTTMTVDELRSLSPGDVLTTQTPAGGEVTLHIPGHDPLVGKAGQFRGKKAIRILAASAESPPCQLRSPPPAAP